MEAGMVRLQGRRSFRCKTCSGKSMPLTEENGKGSGSVILNIKIQ